MVIIILHRISAHLQIQKKPFIFNGACCRTRTGTSCGRQILSLLCLPIPPSRPKTNLLWATLVIPFSPFNKNCTPKLTFCDSLCTSPWRSAGVVDRDGLENRCARKRTVGSNPTFSAMKQKRQAIIKEHIDGFVLISKAPRKRGYRPFTNRHLSGML